MNVSTIARKFHTIASHSRMRSAGRHPRRIAKFCFLHCRRRVGGARAGNKGFRASGIQAFHWCLTELQSRNLSCRSVPIRSAKFIRIGVVADLFAHFPGNGDFQDAEPYIFLIRATCYRPYNDCKLHLILRQCQISAECNLRQQPRMRRGFFVQKALYLLASRRPGHHSTIQRTETSSQPACACMHCRAIRAFAVVDPRRSHNLFEVISHRWTVLYISRESIAAVRFSTDILRMLSAKKTYGKKIAG
jgi:hypothetical protein